MHSSIGISMTIFTIILLIGYLASQIKVMVGGEQPIISITNELNQHETDEEALDLNNKNFFLGFGIKDVSTKLAIPQFKNDPRFVRWYVSIDVTVDDGPRGMREKSIAEIGVHPCNDEEWKRLFPGSSDLEEKRIRSFKTGEDIMCLDKKDKSGKDVDLRIFG